MKVGLSGFGAMGRETANVLRKKGIPFATIDPVASDADFTELSSVSLAGIDVVIDFTRPDAALSNIECCCALGKNLVMGTTGWYDSLDQVKTLVGKSGIGFLYATNFSIGVQMFLRIVAEASRLVNGVADYDIFLREIHHARKADSPSGTALTLAEIVLANVGRKTSITTETLDRKIEPGELHVTSTRGGFVPGTHEVILDSEADTIELRHVVRNRSGFAAGAVMAAEFINGKSGVFIMDDLVSSLVRKDRGTQEE